MYLDAGCKSCGELSSTPSSHMNCWEQANLKEARAKMQPKGEGAIVQSCQGSYAHCGSSCEAHATHGDEVNEWPTRDWRPLACCLSLLDVGCWAEAVQLSRNQFYLLLCHALSTRHSRMTRMSRMSKGRACVCMSEGVCIATESLSMGSAQWHTCSLSCKAAVSHQKGLTTCRSWSSCARQHRL